MESIIFEWIQNGFFALSSFILMYFAHKIGRLVDSVDKLHNKLSIYITKHDHIEGELREIKTDFSTRIRYLERGIKNGN